MSDMPVVMLIAGVRMPELLRSMLDAGASPNARYGVPRGEGDPAKYPYEGESLLVKSLFDPALVRLLLEHGVNVDGCVHGRNMMLAHTAAERAADSGCLESLKLLLEAGASARLDGVAARLQARLWPTALEPRRLELLKILREKGAEIHPGRRIPRRRASC